MMAKMLGDTPSGHRTIYHGWRGRKPSEVELYRERR